MLKCLKTDVVQMTAVTSLNFFFIVLRHCKTLSLLSNSAGFFVNVLCESFVSVTIFGCKTF